jgi:hypothetical protein
MRKKMVTGDENVSEHPEGRQDAEHPAAQVPRLELGEVRPRDRDATAHAATKIGFIFLLLYSN